MARLVLMPLAGDEQWAASPTRATRPLVQAGRRAWPRASKYSGASSSAASTRGACQPASANVGQEAQSGAGGADVVRSQGDAATAAGVVPAPPVGVGLGSRDRQIGGVEAEFAHCVAVEDQ